jgi:hypothetical protein
MDSAQSGNQRPLGLLARIQQIARIRRVLPGGIEIMNGDVPVAAILHVLAGGEPENA